MNTNQTDLFRFLHVVSITSFGAFLDWGQEKDLFLPLSEQTQSLRMNDGVFVGLYTDHEGRPCSTMRIERFISEEIPKYKIEQKVEAWIYQETELGFKVLVNSMHLGLIYKNEIFQDVRIGEKVTAYVKKVRDDHKIDLNLRPAGHKANDDITFKIISLLEANKGFYALTDKTPPEKIYELFGVSKKKYKIALGALYKKRLIQIEDAGVRLTQSPATVVS